MLATYTSPKFKRLCHHFDVATIAKDPEVGARMILGKLTSIVEATRAQRERPGYRGRKLQSLYGRRRWDCYTKRWERYRSLMLEVTGFDPAGVAVPPEVQRMVGEYQAAQEVLAADERRERERARRRFLDSYRDPVRKREQVKHAMRNLRQARKFAGWMVPKTFAPKVEDFRGRPTSSKAVPARQRDPCKPLAGWESLIVDSATS